MKKYIIVFFMFLAVGLGYAQQTFTFAQRDTLSLKMDVYQPSNPRPDHSCVVYVFGGGFISGLIKHSKMSDAESEIEAARRSLERFSKELRDIDGYSSVHINGFLTFGDLFCDGFLMDVLVQSQIGKAKRECEDAINQVSRIRNDLQRML